MPTAITRDEVRQQIDAGAQLVEVLPRDEYDEEHLPNAIHLPLKELTAETAGVLDRRRPVIVYCWDALCDMSPRAAWRLERMGFEPVFDYALGKVDWISAGLPTERAAGSGDRAIDAADQNPRTCGPDEPAGALPHLSRRSPLIVINEERIVLGRIDALPPDANDTRTAADVMIPGPPTVRAHEPLAELLDRMAARKAAAVIVTTPEGRLLGLIAGS